MKTASKNRQTSVATVSTDMSAPRVTTINVETQEPNDSPAVQKAWLRLYEAITGKRTVARQKGLVHQH